MRIEDKLHASDGRGRLRLHPREPTQHLLLLLSAMLGRLAELGLAVTFLSAVAAKLQHLHTFEDDLAESLALPRRVAVSIAMLTVGTEVALVISLTLAPLLGRVGPALSLGFLSLASTYNALRLAQVRRAGACQCFGRTARVARGLTELELSYRALSEPAWLATRNGALSATAALAIGFASPLVAVAAIGPASMLIVGMGIAILRLKVRTAREPVHSAALAQNLRDLLTRYWYVDRTSRLSVVNGSVMPDQRLVLPRAVTSESAPGALA